MATITMILESPTAKVVTSAIVAKICTGVLLNKGLLAANLGVTH
jgi:hypothetical protein